MDHIVVDVEIKKAIGQDGLTWDDTDKLGVSTAVVYEFQTDRFRVYGDSPEELIQLQSRLRNAELISGYNIWKFDFPVIFGLSRQEASRMMPVSLGRTNDLLRRIWAAQGFDPDVFDKTTHGNWGLDVVARGTLKSPGKIANGAKAPEWYQAGAWGRLVNYCVDDVTLERDLTVFIDKYGYIVNGNTGQVVRL